MIATIRVPQSKLDEYDAVLESVGDDEVLIVLSAEFDDGCRATVKVEFLDGDSHITACLGRGDNKSMSLPFDCETLEGKHIFDLDGEDFIVIVEGTIASDPDANCCMVGCFESCEGYPCFREEPDLESHFEHGQWWISDLVSGAQWSVVDAGDGIESWVSFEQVSEGKE